MEVQPKTTKGGGLKPQRRKKVKEEHKMPSSEKESNRIPCIEDWMPGYAPQEWGEESDVDRMQKGKEDVPADQQTSKEAQHPLLLSVRDEATMERNNKRSRREAQPAPREEKPSRLYEGDSQDLLSMEEEQSSQPKRQRKITEYAQMQQQKQGMTSKVTGEAGNKPPKVGDEEKGTAEGTVKSVDKNTPSQDMAPIL